MTVKIAHIGLSSFFTEGMTYQDNQLAHQNAIDGNVVLYIANSQKYVNGEILDTGYEDIVLEDGVRLIRLPYKKIINTFVSSKVKKVSGIYEILKDFKPDVILSHDLAYLSVTDVIRYKKQNPQTRLYADTHATKYNCRKNWLSLNILHRKFYRHLIQKALKYHEKYFYIGLDEKEFSILNYGVPENMMEFFPLGGNCFQTNEYEKFRGLKRKELNLDNNTCLYLHTGKLTSRKKTVDLLNAYYDVQDGHSRMVIIGKIPKEQEQKLTSLINRDERVSFLGWKSGDELKQYLCACDMYCQPGGGSATLQNAICCGCAIMAHPYKGYQFLEQWGNVMWVEKIEDIKRIFIKNSKNPIHIDEMKMKSKKCGEEMLDYKVIAKKLYE